jgi:chitinase
MKATSPQRSRLRPTALFFLLLGTISSSPQSHSHPSAPDAWHPRLTGYFPQWGLYNQPQYTVKNLLTAGGASVLDQMNYAQGFVTGGRCSIADPNADLNYTFPAEQSVDGIADQPNQIFRGNLNQLVKLKRKLPNLKLIISLEGRAQNFAEDAQPQNRAAFVDSCIDLFLKGNLAPGIQAPGLFDGIDIDWEYPHQEDAANYLALLTEFRRKMDALRPGLRLNIAVGPSPRMYPGTDLAAVNRLVDQVGLMTYDFDGPWSTTTGFISPLRLAPGQDGGTVDHTVQAYHAAGIPTSKLLVGLPFYGYGWHRVAEDNNGLFQEGQAIRGDRPYRAIADLVPQSTVYRDPDSQAPWLFDGDNFWTYEDPISIQRKSEYIRQQHLGGFMIWELGEDTPSAALLHAAHQGLQSLAPGLPAASKLEALPPATYPAQPAP